MNNEKFNQFDELKTIDTFPRRRNVWILIQSLSLCDKLDVEIDIVQHQKKNYYYLIDVIGLTGLPDSERSNTQKAANKLISEGYLDTVTFDRKGVQVVLGATTFQGKKYVRLSEKLEAVFNL